MTGKRSERWRVRATGRGGREGGKGEWRRVEGKCQEAEVK